MAHKLKSNNINTATKNKQNYKSSRQNDNNNETITSLEFKQESIDDDEKETDFLVNAENSLDEDEIYGDSNDMLNGHNKDSGNSTTETTYNNRGYTRKVFPIESKCNVCSKNFSQQRDLVKHAQQFHPNDKAFKCRHCPTLFSKIKSLSTHFKRCHANLANTISCEYCYKSFFAQFQLERHRRTHTEYNNDLENNKDNRNSNIVGADDDIYENRKGKIYPIQKKCAICNKTFSHQKMLVQHCQKAHPNEKTFKCLYCPTVFSKLKSVTTHYKRSHSKTTKTIFCEYCNMSFFTKFLLERHLRSHTEQRPFHCNLCDKSYKYKRNLDVHLRTHSNNENSLNNPLDEYGENDEEEEHFLTEEDDYDNVGEEVVDDDSHEKETDFLVNAECSADEDEIYDDSNDLMIEHNKDNSSRTMATKHSTNREYLRKVYPIENKCFVCLKNFSQQKELIRHAEQFHPNDKAFKCRQCPTLFSKLKSLSSHFKRRHAHLAKTISCEFCNKTFFVQFHLERHRRTHSEYNNKLRSSHTEEGDNMLTGDDEYCENDEEDEYYDNNEHSMFAKDEYYENDDGTEEDDNEQEGNSFHNKTQEQHKNNRINQKTHQKNNEIPTEVITIDDDDHAATVMEYDNSNLYNSTYFIIDEFNTDTEQDEEFTAADYSNTDNGNEGYAAGDIVSVSAETDQHECGVCMKLFTCQQAVARHLHRHHPEIEFFKCPYCDDNFYGLDLLAEHIKVMKHIQKPNICKYCLKSFDRRTDLNRHIRIHTDERPYSCNVCDTSFKQVNHLKRHKESMHGILFQPQKFNCKLCTKSFTEADILKRHMSIHENKQNSYPCTMCSKIFKTRYDWQRHEQTHSSRMDLICEYCLKSFDNNETLNRHLKVHKGEFKFLCTICKKTFRRKSHLVNHHKSHRNS
ncbi:zinc finger protein 271-like isoform X1 [Lucilia cuprina]|uniref:zinc finger protein 271-like isoform X1 n=1 Tax=Lucilia cuprina TaxID=7375 RepID=UPI001F0512DF|nr:zinc finger protein 271-like isoform X1 [Lucilia cuprina]